MFDWNDLKAFLAVARGGSTLAASKALGVNQTTVARRIESLEHSAFEYRRLTVPASDYAMEFVGRPLPNAALLGGYAAATKQVALESVVRAIEERFPAKIAEGNIKAARAAFDYVRAQKVEAMANA